MKPITLPVIATLLFTPPAFASDDDDMEGMDEISLEDLLNIEITTASKTKLTAEQAPGIVSVVTQAEITKMGARTLTDALETVPGITVGGSLQGGFHKTIYVRGGHSFFSEDVLILKDGIRLNDGFTGGGITMSPDYPVDNIKQIEIIRGPGSALYGANGFIGVINIITQDANESKVSVRARAGDMDGKHLSLNYKNKVDDDLQWRFFLSYDNDDFEEIPVDDNIYLGVFPHSNYQMADHNEILNAEFKFKFNSFQLMLDYTDMEVTNNWGLGVPVDTYTDLLGNQINRNDEDLRNYSEGSNYGISGKYNRIFSDTLTMDVVFSKRFYSNDFWYMLGNNFDTDLGVAETGFASGFGIEVKPETFSADVGFTWTPDESNTSVFGLNYQRDKMDFAQMLGNTTVAPVGHPLYRDPATTNIFFPEIVVASTPLEPNGSRVFADDRKVKAVYAQHTWLPSETMGLTVGVRIDDYSDFGETTNPRAAFVYSPTKKLSFKALYGQAFRAPSFYEKNFDLNAIIVTNDDIEAETVKTLEFQANYKVTPGWLLSLTSYQFDVEDLISQVPTALIPGVGNPAVNLFETQFINAGELQGDGFEFETRYRTVEGTALFLNYSSSTVEEELFGVITEAQGVPKKAMNVGINLEFLDNDLILNATVTKRWDINPQPAINLAPTLQLFPELKFPDSTQLNIHSEYHWKDGIVFTFDVRNAQDDRRIFADQHFFAANGIAIGRRQYLLGFRMEI